MDIFLLIVVIIVGLLLLYVNIYLLALYCHPEDGGFGASLICKIVVVLGLTLSWCQTLMLTLDVSNIQNNAGFNMEIAWMIIYVSLFVTITVLIPISIFFYESDEDKALCNRIAITMFEQLIVCIFVGVTIFLTYYYLSNAKIPVSVITVDSALFVDSSLDIVSTELIQTSNIQRISMQVTVITFIAGLLCFVGYFTLILYGGVGLAALPLDMIFAFKRRPVVISSVQAQQKKNQLGQRVKQFIEYAQILKDEEKELKFNSSWFSKRSKSAKLESKYAKLCEAVDELEEENEIFKMELDMSTSNPIIYVLKLVLGFLLLIVTICWWMHILLYIIIIQNGKPANPFLNTLFIQLESHDLGFLSVFFYGLFTLYLLWCVTKGNMVFKLPWIFSFHPMKINETWMNSFLFNIALILLSSVALTHFSTIVFSQYTRFTTIGLMFGIQIKHLVMMSWAFENRVFEIALFSWSLLCALYFLIMSCRKSDEMKQIEDRKKALKGFETELQELFIKKS
ncbi:hypothetical protein pb186bvf_007747 [Paramecium bursaria]